MKIVRDMSIWLFNPWDGAVYTMAKLDSLGKLDEFENLIEELYPEGLTLTKLNDILWFESEWIFDKLGIKGEV